MTGADLVLIAVATLLGAFVKAVTGMGLPLIAVPILSLTVGVEDAVAVLAIPNTLANLSLNRGTRHHRHETRDLPVLVAGAIVGAAIGTLVLVRAPEEPLVVALAATVLLFVVQRARNPELHLSRVTTRRWAPVAGTAAGISQGAVGVSGPIVAMWFHGYRLGKDAYVYSITALFLMAGVAQLAVLTVTGAFDRDRLVAAALATVATVAMVPLGTRVRSRLDGPTFERLILALLVVSAVSLLTSLL